ncbi:MAG: CHAT domain-containing protein [bacterium]|nr:CHAT domain-containing protein [bacterium]
MDFFSIIIDRVNSTNVFNMVQGRLPSRDTHLQTRVDDDLIQEFLQETERLSRIANSFEANGAGGSGAGEAAASSGARNASIDVSGELRRMGETFFLQFFPEQIQDRLRSARDSFLFLHVDHRLRDIPWEILHTGQCFLADKFFLGKNIAGYWREASRSERDQLKMLIIADPTEDLEWARLEGEGLFESLNAEVSPDRLDVQFLSGRRITKLSLLNAIKDRDIIHYAGHMYYSKDQQESGWLLADGKVLRAREIEKAGVVPDLVFANSCLSFAAGQSADAGAAQSAGLKKSGEADASGSGDRERESALAQNAGDLEAARGMTDSGNVFNDLAGAFLRAGIHNYVGTNWEISDNIRTYEFALQFYRSIFEERSVGEALYEARRQARRLYESSDLTWARYSLHGNPMSRIYRQGGRRSFDASRNVLHARTVLDSYPGPIAGEYSRFLELTESGADPAESLATLWRVFENIVRVIGALIFGNAGYLNVKIDAPAAGTPAHLRMYVELLYAAMGRLRSLNMEVSPGRLLECMYLHRDTIDKFLDAREAWATGRLGEDYFDSYIVTYHYFIDNLLSDLAPLGRYQIVYLEGDSGRARLLNGLESRNIQVLPAEFEDPQLRQLIGDNADRVCFYNSSRKILFSLEDGMSYDPRSGEITLAPIAPEKASESSRESRPAESSSEILP